MDQAQCEWLATQLTLPELRKAYPEIGPDQRAFIYEEDQWYQTSQNVMARPLWQWFLGTLQAHLQVALSKNEIRRQISLTLTIITAQILTLSDCSSSNNLYRLMKLTRHGYPWCKGRIRCCWTQAEYSRGKSAVWLVQVTCMPESFTNRERSNLNRCQ